MSDVISWTQYLLAMLVLLGLLGGLGLVTMAIQRGWLSGQIARLSGSEPAKRRLAVTESLVLDPRRRVVLLRCDEREHLVLLGPTGETVLESREDRS